MHDHSRPGVDLDSVVLFVSAPYTLENYLRIGNRGLFHNNLTDFMRFVEMVAELHT